MKTRTLVFNAENSSMFPFLYAGFLNGGNGPAPKGVEVLRREVRILDKMEAVSIEADGERFLKEGEQRVALEQPEYELLKKYFENTPWNTGVSRQVVEIIDWLATIPLEENGG